MEALSAIPEQDDILSYVRAGAPESRRSSSERERECEPPPPPPDLNVFAGRPVKRFKVSHHELVPVPVRAPLRPQYLVSRQALDREGTPYTRFADLETHELTVRNHGDTLLLVMADSAFDPAESILYYEIETKSEASVATMAIERRYVGLELIGGAARDAAAIERAAATSQPYDPALDIRSDSRFPLALKSRFLQAPLNAYEWAVRLHQLFGDVGGPTASALPNTQAWHRIGLLLDRGSHTLSATRDGQVVATTRISDDAAHLNLDVGLVPVFSLAKHGVARVIFGSPELENNGFKFDLEGYIQQRQREAAALVNKEVDSSIPMGFFSDFFQYYGYERSARATGKPLRASVPARALIRKAILSGNAAAVPEILSSHFAMPGSKHLVARVEHQSANEFALQHLLADTVPDAEGMKRVTTREAAAILVRPKNSDEPALARKQCLLARTALLDLVLDEVSVASSESFGPPAFGDSRPVLRDLAQSFIKIAERSSEKNGSYALLCGYLKHEYKDEFPQ